MFDLFRSRAKAVRYLLGAILMLVAISMVVTLIPGFGTDVRTDSQVVAEIGEEPLTIMEVSQVVQRQIRARAFPSEMAALYIPQLVNQMVAESALAYEAERRGFHVSKEDVARTIQTIFPQLYENGKFVGREVYAQFLAQQNLTIPEFENSLRKELLMNKLRAMVLEGIIVTPAEIEREFRLRNEKVKIEYVPVAAEKFQSEVQVSPEEIQKHFEANRQSFRVPEKRSLAVLVVDQDQVARTVTVSESDLRAAYEAQKESFRTPERVKVRHILLKTTEKSPDEISKITARAQDLLKQLRQGADFAELARKNSEDPGSASKGGDLGWIVRGQTVPAFEQAAFSMKPGQISDLITTQYGIHIVQVLEKQEAHLQTLDEVRAQLTEERKKQLVYDRMQALADQARAALVKSPRDADRIAAELGLQVFHANRIGPNDPIPGLGVSRELSDAISTLRQGDVSPVTQIQPTKLAVAAVTELLPARPAELADVEAQIRQQLADQKLRALVATRARELVDKARSFNGDLKKAAQLMGLELKTPPEVARTGSVEGLGSASLVLEAFTSDVGRVFGPVSTGDQQFVCKVVAKIPADLSQLEAQRESLRQEIRNERARERIGLFEDSVLKQLIAEKKVKIYQAVINRMVADRSRQ